MSFPLTLLMSNQRSKLNINSFLIDYLQPTGCNSFNLEQCLSALI